MPRAGDPHVHALPDRIADGVDDLVLVARPCVDRRGGGVVSRPVGPDPVVARRRGKWRFGHVNAPISCGRICGLLSAAGVPRRGRCDIARLTAGPGRPGVEPLSATPEWMAALET